MRTLQLNKILEYYDVPQILIATDAIGVHYLCVLYNYLENGGYQYLAMQIALEKLTSFINGHEDLRDLFETPAVEDCYYNVIVVNGVLKASPLLRTDITEDMLPFEGYSFDSDSQEEDNIIIAETLACNHPIVRLGFEDRRNSHTIDASCLSQAIAHYQSLVSNCYKKINGKELLHQAELRVTTFQAASFDVHFQVNADLNLFGSSNMDGTFRQLDKLFNADNEEVFKEVIKDLRGHTVNSYKNFLEVLIEHRLNVKYKWVASIADNEVVSGRMSLPRIKYVYDLLQKSQELQSEDISFEGIFLASSVENGKWTFKPTGERRNINGISENNDILSGVIIEQQIYKIHCKEIQEQNIVSLKISKKLVLHRLDKINS